MVACPGQCCRSRRCNWCFAPSVSGHVLVTNTPGTRVELWPSDLPATWAARLAELRKLAAVTGVSTKEIVAALAKHGDDPLTPVVVQRGIKQQQIYYLLEHQDEFPGVRLPQSYLRKYPYQSLAAQVSPFGRVRFTMS